MTTLATHPAATPPPVARQHDDEHGRYDESVIVHGWYRRHFAPVYRIDAVGDQPVRWVGQGLGDLRPPDWYVVVPDELAGRGPVR